MKLFILAIAIVLAHFPVWGSADYGPVFKHLLSEDFVALKSEVLRNIQKSSSVSKNREMLKLLLAHEAKLYDVQRFESKVIPFNEGGCQAGDEEPTICGKFQGYGFALQKAGDGQVLRVYRDEATILEYKTKRQTRLTEAGVKLGTAIHVIAPVGSRKNFYFLVREIEHLGGRSIREDILIFKVEGETTCQIAGSDFLTTNDHYELLAIFIKALGNKIYCGAEILRI